MRVVMHLGGASNVIDKFPFASDFSGTATDVGDLTTGRYYGRWSTILIIIYTTTIPISFNKT